MRHIDKLQARLNDAPDGELREVMTAQIAAAAANPRPVLETVFANHLAALRAAPEAWLDLFVTACLLDQLGLAAEMLRAWHGMAGGLHLATGLTSSRSYPDILRWRCDGDGRHDFLFREGMTAHGNADFLFRLFARAFPLIAHAIAGGDMPAGQVAWNFGDVTMSPGLSYSSGRDDAVLIPDHYFVWRRGYAAERDAIDTAAAAVTQRTRKAYWRGTTAGETRKPPQSWLDLQRTRVCRMGRADRLGDLIDAKFTSVTSDLAEPPDTLRRILTAQGMMAPWAAQQDIVSYAYQIDIDGHTNSYPGFFLKLYSGLPVLKVASPFGNRQWYYDRVQPGEHYLPVAADLSDLRRQILWLRAHPAEAARIGAAGRAVAQAMTYETELAKGRRIIRQAFAAPG